MYSYFFALSLVVSLLAQIKSFLWILFLLWAKYNGYDLASVQNNECSVIQNKLAVPENAKANLCIWFVSLSMNHEKKPNGLFFGRFKDGTLFIGEVSTGTGSNKDSNGASCGSLWILTAKQSMDCILKSPNSVNLDKDKEYILSKCEQVNHGYHFQFAELPFLYKKEPTEWQKSMITKIMTTYSERENKYCSVFIHGKPFTGKSSLMRFLSRELKAKIVKFDPTKVGGSAINWYNALNPTADNPIILLMDECDVIIDDIINKKVPLHRDIVGQMSSKTDWNSFLDDFDAGVYQNTILLLTSNMSSDEICEKIPRLISGELDKSILRKGRIDINEESQNSPLIIDGVLG